MPAHRTCVPAEWTASPGGVPQWGSPQRRVSELRGLGGIRQKIPATEQRAANRTTAFRACRRPRPLASSRNGRDRDDGRRHACQLWSHGHDSPRRSVWNGVERRESRWLPDRTSVVARSTDLEDRASPLLCAMSDPALISARAARGPGPSALAGHGRSRDLGVVDALRVHGGDGEVAVAELASDDHERYAFVGESASVRAAQLVRATLHRTPAPAAVSRSCARGRDRPAKAARRAGDEAGEPPRELDPGGQPRLQLRPPPQSSMSRAWLERRHRAILIAGEAVGARAYRRNGVACPNANYRLGVEAALGPAHAGAGGQTVWRTTRRCKASESETQPSG